jgi:hypothetical protein
MGHIGDATDIRVLVRISDRAEPLVSWSTIRMPSTNTGRHGHNLRSVEAQNLDGEVPLQMERDAAEAVNHGSCAICKSRNKRAVTAIDSCAISLIVA